MELTSKQRKYLTAKAHALSPVVMVGRQGESDGVVHALDEAVGAHELVKLRFQAEKENRRIIAQELAEKTGAVLVRITGNVALFYRPLEDKEKRSYHLPKA